MSTMLYYLIMAKKRKTREEKIIAGLKRELKEVKRKLKKIKKKEEILPEEKQVKKSKTTNLYPPFLAARQVTPDPYLKKDLTKTLILSILAIGIELVVYWLTTKGIGIFDMPAQLKTKLF